MTERQSEFWQEALHYQHRVDDSDEPAYIGRCALPETQRMGTGPRSC
jgi:hypothetical protein